MAKVKEYIAQIRSLIKQYSDDTAFSDIQLYKLVIDAIAIMNEREANKFTKISDWNYKTFCVELCQSVSHVCGCITVGCKVLKTIYEIPSPISGRNKDLIQVLTLDGRELPQVTEEEIQHRKYDPIFANKLMYSVVNQQLVIWNADVDHVVPRALQIRAVWEDISEWDGKELCPNGNTTVCYDIYEEELSIDRKYHFMIYNEILRMLNIQIQLKEDITNDSSNKIVE